MKFVSDSEQVFSHPTLDHKPDSRPFVHQDNALESSGLKSGNGVVKEYQNGVFCASKANEGDANQLPYMTSSAEGWNVTKPDHSKNLNDITNDNEKDVRDLAEQHSHSFRETESVEDSVFYMDKSVMECELPELIVCYKESTYHIKDICIDEGVPSRDRILFESDVDEKGVCSFLPLEKDRNGEQTEEKITTVMLLPDVLNSLADNDSNKDIVDQHYSSPKNDSDEDTVDLCDSKDLLLTEEVKDDATDKITIDVSKKFSLGDLLSMQDLATKNSHSELSNNGNEVEKEQGFSGKSVLASPALVLLAEESTGGTGEAIFVSSDIVSAANESNNGSSKATLANPSPLSVAEEKHNDSKEATRTSPNIISGSEESANVSTVEQLIYNSKVETGSITFDFDASATAEQGREECPQNADSKHNETPDMLTLEEAPHLSVSSQVHCSPVEEGFSAIGRLEEAPCQSVSNEVCISHGEASFSAAGRLEEPPRQSVSSQVHSGLVEANFSAAAPLSGLISYSGPIAYSGSLSLRSDSSTTSTRSFAFPILQSEWNSSPVRMAKADRRHYRKHKFWRQGLLCCRF